MRDARRRAPFVRPPFFARGIRPDKKQTEALDGRLAPRRARRVEKWLTIDNIIVVVIKTFYVLACSSRKKGGSATNYPGGNILL